MDKAGRITLPKAMRDRLGLRAGAELEIQDTPEGIVLKAIQVQPTMIKKQGLWVHTVRLARWFDITKAIRDDREDRI
jgi:AbrB family looped-hinge helix DNA binding protein